MAPLKIAVLHGAEPYQAYHVADIARELAVREGVEVTSLVGDEAVLPHLDRLEAGGPTIAREMLYAPGWVRAGRRLKILGNLKQQVLAHPRNLARLAAFDIVVTPTTHVAAVREQVPGTRFVYCYHGAGARAMSYTDKMRRFDLVLPPGQATVDRLVADGLVAPHRAFAPGHVKIDAARRLAATRPTAFSGKRPVVLFNPHSQAKLSSWGRFARPLIEAARDGAFDLIVAPHVKMFSRRPAWVWRRWQRLALPGRVVIDLGSPAALDMSHALAADLYVGDVSSQVYEFLTRPRPCVFLNAHGADWRGNRDYPMWTLGEVADTPGQALAMIARAEAMHPRFLAAQHAAVAAHLGDLTPGAAARAAERILALAAA